MCYTIQKMPDTDWEAVKKIYQQAVNEGHSTFHADSIVWENWDKEHLQDGRFVLKKNNAVIGWCALSSTSSKKAYWGNVELSIYIDEAFRDKGYGKQLMDYICAESEKMGYWCLYSVICAVNTASIRLHEKCGFRKIGYREKAAQDRFGIWQDVVLYEKRSKCI